MDRATTAQEALVQIRSRRYALVVSDVHGPDLDGPAFYRELVGVDPDLAHRVLFITGDVLSPDTRRFLQETGVPYVGRPFGVTTFQAAVRRVLREG